MLGFLSSGTVYVLLTILPPYDSPSCTYQLGPNSRAGATVSTDGTIDLTNIKLHSHKPHRHERNTTIEFKIVNSGILLLDNNNKPSNVPGVVPTTAAVYPKTIDIEDQFTPPFFDDDLTTSDTIDMEYNNYWNWGNLPSPPLRFGINFLVQPSGQRGSCDPNIVNTPVAHDE